MRSGPVVVALATGLLPAGVFGAAIDLDICSVESVLEYFACLKPVPEACFDNLAEQAMAWCGRYLSIEPVTVYRTTVTQSSTETVTETATATATTIEVDITTVEVPQTATVTDVVEATVTETVTVNGVVVASVYRRVVSDPPTTVLSRDSTSATTSATTSAAATAAPSCIDLGKKNLLRHPASRLSRACSCLDPHPTTTLDATTVAGSAATVTEISTVTVVVPETTMSTELATKVVATQDVTVTETVKATATLDSCDLRFSTTTDLSQLGSRLQDVPGIATSRECCQLCYKTESCAVAISSADGQCRLFTLPSHTLDYEPTPGDQCPYGMLALNGAAPAVDGPVFKGPCWIPGY